MSTTKMVFGNYQVTITPSKIFYEGYINNKPFKSGGFCGFQIQVGPNQVGPETKKSRPTVFFVLPQNKDTIIIAVPYNNRALYPFFVNRQSEAGRREKSSIT